MNETSKCFLARRKLRHFDNYLKGTGIDIGAGGDLLRIISGGPVRAWDYGNKDSDAQHMAGISDETYDFVYSSHTLEQLVDIKLALKNWVRILKTNGFLYIVIPDYYLYEKLRWPSRYNGEHRHSFSLDISRKEVNRTNHFNVFEDLVPYLATLNVETISCTLEDEGFNYDSNFSIDQTLGQAKAQICIIAKKLPVGVTPKFPDKHTKDVAKISTTPTKPITEVMLNGSDKPCVFFPFHGEFGFFILAYIRFVQYFNCPKKVVCCNPGDEVFFPSATDFEYNWESLGHPNGQFGPVTYGRGGAYQDLLIKLQSKYPDHEIIELPGELPRSEIYKYPVTLVPNSIQNIKVDVVIGPRKREVAEHRNYTHWPELVDRIDKAGYKVGAIGAKESSLSIPKVVNNWNFERPNDASIEMLSNAKLYIGTDTGTTHMAATVGTNILAFRANDGTANFFPYIKKFPAIDVFRIVEDGWDNLDKVVEEALAILVAMERGKAVT